MRRPEVAMFLVGLIVLAVGSAIAGGGDVPQWEEDVFRAINDLPGAIYPIQWPLVIWGTLIIVPIVAVIALLLRRYALALAVLGVGVGKLVTERIVKAFVSRQRPGTSIGPDIHARGDVSLSGESFVSGHAVLAAAMAVVVAPYVPPRWRWAIYALPVLVAFARVYVGAHNPLDVICGGALGVSLGLAVLWAQRAVERTRSNRDSPITSRVTLEV